MWAWETSLEPLESSVDTIELRRRFDDDGEEDYDDDGFTFDEDDDEEDFDEDEEDFEDEDDLADEDLESFEDLDEEDEDLR